MRLETRLREVEQRLADIEKRMAFYDSGWLADNNNATGLRTYTHNLSLEGPPSRFELWFSPEGNDWYPVGMSGMQTQEVSAATGNNWRNPSFVRVRTNHVDIGVYVAVAGSQLPLWSSYTGGGWVNYASGYWRYRIWR